MKTTNKARITAAKTTHAQTSSKSKPLIKSSSKAESSNKFETANVRVTAKLFDKTKISFF